MQCTENVYNRKHEFESVTRVIKHYMERRKGGEEAFGKREQNTREQKRESSVSLHKKI